MAETEPTSAIFVSKSDASTLQPIWPEHSVTDLPHQQASQIRNRSEVYGVYHGGERTGYGFQIKDGEYFDIVTKDWKEKSYTPEFEARLAREVEAKVGREGLTIILY